MEALQPRLVQQLASHGAISTLAIRSRDPPQPKRAIIAIYLYSRPGQVTLLRCKAWCFSVTVRFDYLDEPGSGRVLIYRTVYCIHVHPASCILDAH